MKKGAKHIWCQHKKYICCEVMSQPATKNNYFLLSNKIKDGAKVVAKDSWSMVRMKQKKRKVVISMCLSMEHGITSKGKKSQKKFQLLLQCLLQCYVFVLNITAWYYPVISPCDIKCTFNICHLISVIYFNWYNK